MNDPDIEKRSHDLLVEMVDYARAHPEQKKSKRKPYTFMGKLNSKSGWFIKRAPFIWSMFWNALYLLMGAGTIYGVTHIRASVPCFLYSGSNICGH